MNDPANDPMNDPASEAGGDRRAVKLLQGYVWHPREQTVTLTDYLPVRLEPDIHVLLDPIPQAPFAFFEDGTLTATQQFYQLTVLTFVENEDDPSGLVPWLAATLQQQPEQTPEGVGWQVMEDLREIG